MKKHLLSVLVLLITASSVFSQAAENQVGTDGKRQGYWKITALMKKLGSPWTPTQLVEEGNYANSMKTGIWIEYFQNGNKKSELTFVNNRANGPAKMYFESGQLSEEGTWVGTRWTGPYKLYYENGNVRQQFTYNALGQRDGEQKYFHPNGQLAISTNIKAGKEEGWTKYYNDQGEVTEENFYAGGVMDPSKTIRHEPKQKIAIAEEDKQEGNAPVVKPGSGEKVNIGTFTGNGFHILYYNGQITKKGEFSNYKLIKGEERLYDNNGKCIRVKLYENGKYIGDGPLPVEEKGK